MQDYYNRIGDQFNSDMEPVISNNFGDVLRRDSVTDNNGVLIAVSTPRINNSFSGTAGFVVSCDQFPNLDANNPAVGGPYTGSSTNGSSNFGEVFYMYQPTSTGDGFGTVGTADYWYRTIRSTFVHETKHVASMAARVANDAPAFEVSWLEEGTARMAEEMWGREAVYDMAWEGNHGYGSAANPKNIYCDVRPGFAECDANSRAPVMVMQRHFASLNTNMLSQNARLLSPFGATPSDTQNYWYATSWSLIRYAIDRFGVSDADFLTALTQASTTGMTNVSARTGVSNERLLGGWALAFAVDDYPGLTTTNEDIEFTTWNLRSIYAGFNADFSGTYTTPYPLVPVARSFGSIAPIDVATMYGGGILWYQLSGNQTKAQLLRLQGNGGAPISSNLRLAVVRVE